MSILQGNWQDLSPLAMSGNGGFSAGLSSQKLHMCRSNITEGVWGSGAFLASTPTNSENVLFWQSVVKKSAFLPL